MADPATSGISSQLASHLASSSGGGGETHTSPLAWVMTGGNIGGANIFAPGQHFAGKLSLSSAMGWFGNALGLKSVVKDKLSMSVMGKPVSKKAKPLQGSNFSVASGGPSISPPSIPTPQAPGGQGQTLGGH